MMHSPKLHQSIEMACIAPTSSIGRFNMVWRIIFDGMSWVVRVRLPNDDTFADREALEGFKSMEIEVAGMKFFGSVSLHVTTERVHDLYDLQVQNVCPYSQGHRS
jgi:hypothetical protein